MATLIELPEWTEGIYQLEEDDAVLGGVDGVDNKQAKQLANRTAYLKREVEKCAPTNNPTFTGTPKAPTPQQTVNDTTLATTAFVKTAIAALVGSAPAALDTLSEIAAALGGDANLKKVLLEEISKKANQTDFTTLKNILVGIPFPYPLSAVPTGCLAFNGQTFNKSTYPELAKKYPSGRLPDLRGEFIRGWDNGRGVDSGRGLLSEQNSLFASHYHRLMTAAGGGTSNVKFGLINDTQAINSGAFTISSNNSNDLIANDYPVQTYNMGGNETRPRNIAFQYICLAA